MAERALRMNAPGIFDGKFGFMVTRGQTSRGSLLAQPSDLRVNVIEDVSQKPRNSWLYVTKD